MDAWVIALLPVAGGLVGAVCNRLFDVFIKKADRKADEATSIRKEMREDIDSMKRDVSVLKTEARDFEKKYQNARSLIVDLDIACSRFRSRVDEMAGVLVGFVRVEECLDAAEVNRARVLLELAERDREMYQQMGIEDRMKEAHVG